MTEDFQKKFHFHSYQPNNETNTSKASTERTKIEKTSDLNFAQFRLFFGGIRLQPRTKHSGVSLNFAKLRTLSFLFTRSISSAGKPNDLICTFFTPPNVHSEWNFFNETSMQPFFGCDEAIVKTRTRIFFSSTEFPMFFIFSVNFVRLCWWKGWKFLLFAPFEWTSLHNCLFISLAREWID